MKRPVRCLIVAFLGELDDADPNAVDELARRVQERAHVVGVELGADSVRWSVQLADLPAPERKISVLVPGPRGPAS